MMACDTWCNISNFEAKRDLLRQRQRVRWL